MARKHALWLKKPAKDDYDNARNYLSLICAPSRADRMVKALHKAETAEWQAKDLLRASALPLLKRANPHVAEDLRKIAKGEPLSPILLVRGDMTKDRPLVVADGYHRICAVYHHKESEPIQCRIVDAAE